MQRLWHFCGASVNHDFGDNGAAGVAIHTFSDPVTDDPVELCPRCRTPLADAYRAQALHVEREAAKPRAVKPSESEAMRKARAWVRAQKRSKKARAAA